MSLKGITNLIIFLLPASRMKNSILRRLGHSIGHKCQLGINLVLNCGTFQLDDFSCIGNLNSFRRIRNIRLGQSAHVGNLNWFSATLLNSYRECPSELLMGNESAITNRHYIDLTGRLVMEAESAIWGVRSTVMTHGVEIQSWKQNPRSVKIGSRTVIGSNSIICPGAELPSNCYFGMGSLISGNRFQPNSLYTAQKSSLRHEIIDTPLERKFP